MSTAQATDRGWGWGWGCLEVKEKPAQQSERRARVEPGAGESGEDTVKAEEESQARTNSRLLSILLGESLTLQTHKL